MEVCKTTTKSDESTGGAAERCHEQVGRADRSLSQVVWDYLLATLQSNTDQGRQPSHRPPAPKTDLEPQTVKVESGQTLKDIAGQHLGKRADQSEVDNHVREIVRLNALTDSGNLQAGQSLELPGYSKDGGYIMPDADGNRVTTWGNGTVRMQRPDGRGYVRSYAADGGYREEQWGKRPQDNFQITKTADDGLQVTDKSSDKPLVWINDADVRSAREKLLELAEGNIRDSQHLSKFRADMARLEHRAQQQGLQPSEVTNTYSAIARILQSESGQPLSKSQRTAVAEQVMSQAATPGSVDQGIYGTCNVAAVEVRTYTRTPAAAASLVADVALAGSYQSTDASKITVRASSLHPYGGASKNPPEDGTRSHASQIFQVTAINLGHLKNNPHYEYVVQASKGNDNGERLYNRMRGGNDEEVLEDGKPVRSPNLSEDQIESLSNIIAGKNETGFVVVHDGYRSGDNITRIKSRDELNDRLQQAQRDGKFPIIVRVDSANQPFFRDSNGGTAGGSDGAHVVTVTGYDAGPPAKVTVDNTWGSQSDHPAGSEITVHDLYMAMRLAGDEDRMKELRRELKFDQRRNQSDPAKVFDLHRQEHDMKLAALNDAEREHMHAKQQRARGEITHREYSHARAAHERAAEQYGNAQEKYYRSVITDAAKVAKTWADKKSQGILKQEELERGAGMMLQVASTLPAEMWLGALKEYQRLGIVTGKQFDESVGEAAQAAQKRWNEERKNGKLDVNEFQKIQSRLGQIIFSLPDDRRRSLIDMLPIEQRVACVQIERFFGKLNAEQYREQLAKTMIKARAYWADAERNHTLDALERQRILSTLKRMLQALPAQDRQVIKRQVDAA